MNAVLEKSNIPNVIGATTGGGFFFHHILVDQRPHAIIVAPKAEGEHPDARWNKDLKRIPGALSYNDSYANTRAMAAAGCPIALWACEQRIGGFEDWCIPARDVLERMYFFGKAHTRSNYCYYRSGENPSALPPAYPYTEALPAQTELDAFRAGGGEAFDEVGYWSSTQFEPGAGFAWAQGFGDGNQDDSHKINEFRVRLVRVILI